jgi:hypothetical protein
MLPMFQRNISWVEQIFGDVHRVPSGHFMVNLHETFRWNVSPQHRDFSTYEMSLRDKLK